MTSLEVNFLTKFSSTPDNKSHNPKQCLQVNWLSLVFMILFLPGSILCICIRFVRVRPRLRAKEILTTRISESKGMRATVLFATCCNVLGQKLNL